MITKSFEDIHITVKNKGSKIPKIIFSSDKFDYNCFMDFQYHNEQSCGVKYEHGLLQELSILTLIAPLSIEDHILHDVIFSFSKLDDYLFTIDFKDRKLSI